MSLFPSLKSLIPPALIAAALFGCADPEPQWRSRGARMLGLDSELAEDPVSGQRVAKGSAVKRDYKGTIYYFESAETAALFDRDPTMYAVVENVPPHDPDDVK